jgi:type IVB pilus formation R64 PilN family outer membrane protein
MPRLTATIPALVLLSGCTGLVEHVDREFDSGAARTSALVKDIGRTAPGAVVKPSEAIVHNGGIWLGKNAVKLSARALPGIFHEPATFDRSVNSLSELAERITLRSGIPTMVNPDAIAVSDAVFGRTEGSAQGLARPSQGGMPLPVGVPRSSGAPPAPLPAPGMAAQGRAMGGTPIRVRFSEGTLKGFLDTTAARFGVSWKYVNGAIQFYHTDSRTFQIHAIPGDSTFTATVASGATSSAAPTGGGASNGAASGGGVTSNNAQNTAVASRLSVFSSIEGTVKVMLSAYGKVISSPATGAITVVDTPEYLERIATYIEDQNGMLSRQIVVNVTVLAVARTEGDELGINWDLVYRNLKQTAGLANTFASSGGGSSFSAGIIGTSNFAGSSLIIDALAKQGKVRQETTASVVTLNNQPVPLQVAKQTSYLQSSQTTLVAQIGATTTLTPGMVTSGFNMSILPHVLTNGTVLLQFSTDLSTLRGIREVVSNGTKIETPEMDTRNFLQRVAMKSNETLIISGFEQLESTLDKSGVGKANNYVLGGGYKANMTKESIVILITPTLVTGS